MFYKICLTLLSNLYGYFHWISEFFVTFFLNSLWISENTFSLTSIQKKIKLECEEREEK